MSKKMIRYEIPPGLLPAAIEAMSNGIRYVPETQSKMALLELIEQLKLAKKTNAEEQARRIREFNDSQEKLL